MPYLHNQIGGIKMYGIDISHWQGNINFDKVLNNNPKIEFIMLKLSQYKSKDNKFDTYYSQISSKIKVGAYIYNKVKTVEQAREEAEYAVKCLNGRKLDCAIWLDMEDSSMKCLGKAKLSEIIDAEAEILMRAGYVVGIYCNRDWYLNVLDGAGLSKKYSFWIARYPASDNGSVKENLSPKGCPGCVMWQYSSKGKVNGISGNVDMNITFTDITNLTQHNNASSQISAASITPDKITVDFNPFPEPTQIVKLKSKGEDVKWVQWFLWRFGLINKSGIDGIFGINTYSAVVQAQKKLGLAADGIVGKITRATWKNTI